MLCLAIQNREIDTAACELVEQSFSAIPPHWQALLPQQIKIILSEKSLARLKALREFWAAQSIPTSSKKFVQVVSPEFDAAEATLWVYYNRNSSMSPPEYYFKKELYALIAQLLWVLSAELREAIAKESSWLGEGARYVSFRDTFSRFFHNPEWLADRKPAAWSFIKSIDETLKLKQAA
jgi:hypothetical protein